MGWFGLVTERNTKCSATGCLSRASSFVWQIPALYSVLVTGSSWWSQLFRKSDECTEIHEPGLNPWDKNHDMLEFVLFGTLFHDNTSLSSFPVLECRDESSLLAGMLTSQNWAKTKQTHTQNTKKYGKRERDDTISWSVYKKRCLVICPFLYSCSEFQVSCQNRFNARRSIQFG